MEEHSAVAPTAPGDIRRGPAAELFADCDAAILLPTLNEENGLAATLAELPFEALHRNGWKVQPLVIDGGSTDRTREVALSYGVPVLEQKSRGKGAAVREGLEWLGRADVQFAVILDADATYPGDAVVPALELLDHGTDLVIGVRQPAKPFSRAEATFRDIVHRLGNALLNLSAELLSNCSLLDICSGFWAVRVSHALALDLRSTDFAIEAELFLKARRSGLTVDQFPIVYRERVGEAKLHAVRDGLRILGAILRFGRRSVGVAVEELSERISHFWRELILILLIEGPRDVVLLTSSEREREAEALAARLRRARLATTVRVDARRPDGVSSLRAERLDSRRAPRTAAIVTMWDEWDETPLAPEGAELPASVRFADGRHQLLIDLPAPVRANPNGLAGQLSRSGGLLRASSREVPRFLQSVMFLAEHLRTDSSATATSMLRANGIFVESLGGADMLDHLMDRGIHPRASHARPPSTANAFRFGPNAHLPPARRTTHRSESTLPASAPRNPAAPHPASGQLAALLRYWTPGSLRPGEPGARRPSAPRTVAPAVTPPVVPRESFRQ